MGRAEGALVNLAKKNGFVKHYSSHVMGPERGHLVVKMSGHPPFSAQVILKATTTSRTRPPQLAPALRRRATASLGWTTQHAWRAAPEALSRPAAIGRLPQVCQHWIYSSVLCRALTTAEQAEARCRYHVPPAALRTITAITTIRDKILYGTVM
jgi:hypothetical protein